jgi:hypothetical protein
MKQMYSSPFLLVVEIAQDICTASTTSNSVEGEVFDSEWGL